MNDDSVLILGDLHGCFYTMVRLLNKTPKGAKVIFHGDTIDRGPNSRKVVEFAMSNHIPTCIANHEDLALAFYNRKSHCGWYYERGIWLSNGGNHAVREWPVDKTHRDRGLGGCVPDEVLSWMEGLPPYLTPSEALDENGRRLLVSHSGYGLCADYGTRDGWLTALWGRYDEDGFPFATDPETGKEIDDGYYRVFGHTRVRKVVVGPTHCNIDSGAAYQESATLTGFLWPSKTIIQQPFDESPIEPTFTITQGIIT